jgi:hypothetical protein
MRNRTQRVEALREASVRDILHGPGGPALWPYGQPGCAADQHASNAGPSASSSGQTAGNSPGPDERIGRQPSLEFLSGPHTNICSS